MYICQTRCQFFFPSNEFFSVSLFPEGYILLVTYDIPNALISLQGQLSIQGRFLNESISFLMIIPEIKNKRSGD